MDLFEEEAKKRQMAAAVVIALRSLRLQKKLCLNRKHTKRFFEETHSFSP